jgi:hypothetical protein
MLSIRVANTITIMMFEGVVIVGEYIQVTAAKINAAIEMAPTTKVKYNSNWE